MRRPRRESGWQLPLVGGVVITKHLVCFPEVVGKELVGTIAAFEMGRGSLVQPERLHLREARTAAALEVVLSVLVLQPNFPRPKGEGTIVALERRMFRLLVRNAALLCAEFAVAVATLDLGLVHAFPVLGENGWSSEHNGRCRKESTHGSYGLLVLEGTTGTQGTACRHYDCRW